MSQHHGTFEFVGDRAESDHFGAIGVKLVAGHLGEFLQWWRTMAWIAARAKRREVAAVLLAEPTLGKRRRDETDVGNPQELRDKATDLLALIATDVPDLRR